MNGKKVLHMDQNPYYGGESASITPLEDVSLCSHLFAVGLLVVPSFAFGPGLGFGLLLLPFFLWGRRRV